MFSEAAFSEAPFSALRSLEVGGIPPTARTAAAGPGSSVRIAAPSAGIRDAAATSPGSREATARRKD